MKAVGEGLYVWPEKDDKAFVPLYDVIKTLKPPSLVARGRYQFGERKHTKVKCSADNSLLLLSDSTIEFIESAVEEVPTQSSEIQETQSSAKIQEGQYVDVFLYGKNGRQSFRGIVDEIDSGELLVRFMKAVGEGLYVWPEKDDKSFVPICDVIKTLKPPSLVARGRYQFH